MSEYQHLAKSRVGEALVVTVTTDHIRTPETSQALRDEMLAAVKDEKAAPLILDLGPVTFIGSMGVLGFLALRRQSQLQRIVLCNLSESIQKFFVSCRLLSNDPDREAPFEGAVSVAEALTQ